MKSSPCSSVIYYFLFHSMFPLILQLHPDIFKRSNTRWLSLDSYFISPVNLFGKMLLLRDTYTKV